MPTRLLVSQAAGGRISFGPAASGDVMTRWGQNPMAWHHGILESSVVHNPVHRRDMLPETTSERPEAVSVFWPTSASPLCSQQKHTSSLFAEHREGPALGNHDAHGPDSELAEQARGRNARFFNRVAGRASRTVLLAVLCAAVWRDGVAERDDRQSATARQRDVHHPAVRADR